MGNRARNHGAFWQAVAEDKVTHLGNAAGGVAQPHNRYAVFLGNWVSSESFSRKRRPKHGAYFVFFNQLGHGVDGLLSVTRTVFKHNVERGFTQVTCLIDLVSRKLNRVLLRAAINRNRPREAKDRANINRIGQAGRYGALGGLGH